MNKGFSTKAKVTLWYSLFIVFLLLIFSFTITRVSSNISESRTANQLTEAVNETLGDIEIDDGEIDDGEIDLDEIDFFEDGVYISLYDDNLDLIYGRLPKGMDQETSFENGTVREVLKQGVEWLIYDDYITLDDANGDIWVRGVISKSGVSQTLDSMLKSLLYILPIMGIFAVFIGYIITARAFKPVSKIIDIADEIGNSNDLSRRINLEGKNDEIHQLANSFDSMFEKLEIAFDKERQFTSDASHELRTPLSVIKSEAEYAFSNAASEEETGEALSVIIGQCSKMERIIAQLLLLARSDGEGTKLEKELIDVGEIAEIVVESQTDIAGEKSISIKTDIKNVSQIYADQTSIIMVLNNLISNAITYGKTGGQIVVKISEADTFIKCTVEDDGIGMDDEQMTKIWDRFYRADSSRTGKTTNNVGLGLPIVKEIVEAHGGKIYVNSQPNIGSEFVFTLPKNI